MSSSRLIQAGSLLLSLLSLFAAGVVVGPVSDWGRSDRQEGIVIQNSGIPAHVELAVAASGPFRALAVDYLWHRARRLQEEGKYFEANHLSRMITALQPRSAFVWAFHAWNMAFNISVETYTPQERWGWVNKGIHLLRDQGIRYNPRAIRLYRELGWIYFFKIGKFTDDMHWFYKRQVARDWEELLGAPTVGATTPQVIEAFRRIAEADQKLLDSIDSNSEMGWLVEDLRSLGYSMDENLLRQLGRILMYERSLAGGIIGIDRIAKQVGIDDRVSKVIARITDRDGVLEPFLSSLRRKVLEDSYRMDPGFMLEMMRRYGPLDWRHPASHAAYWSDMGMKMIGADPGNMDLLNTNRQVIHSLQFLTRYGLLSYDPVSNQIDLLPDPRFVMAYDMAYDLAKERFDRGEYSSGAGDTFEDGHENFLMEALTLHYLYGDESESRRFFRKVRQLYGAKPKNIRSGRYRKPLVQLIAEELRTHGDMMGTAGQFLRSMLRAGFERGLGQGRMDVFERFVKLARYQHRVHQEDRMTKAITEQGRMRFLEFEDVMSETYLLYMQTPAVPVMTRVRIWANAPKELNWKVQDRLLPILAMHARQFGLDPVRAFPEVNRINEHDGPEDRQEGLNQDVSPPIIQRK